MHISHCGVVPDNCAQDTCAPTIPLRQLRARQFRAIPIPRRHLRADNCTTTIARTIIEYKSQGSNAKNM